MMSRRQAKREVHGGELRQRLEAEGIRVRAGSLAGLAEEAPVAYKDVDWVSKLCIMGHARKWRESSARRRQGLEFSGPVYCRPLWEEDNGRK